jgi:hypothetical protein
VSARQLRARLDRLTRPATSVIGLNRDRDRRYRAELEYRKLSPAGLTELEKAEYLKLEALFHEEDRDRNRLADLSIKDSSAQLFGTLTGIGGFGGLNTAF